MKTEDFIKRLDYISYYNGIPYGRILLISEEEEKHKKATSQYAGYHALSCAFKCHVLETVELFNTQCIPTINASMSEFYKIFLPKLFQKFSTICGAEQSAILGYPYQGYTLLRNVFDNLVLLSAALQKIADFYSIDGIVPGKPVDHVSMKKLRISTEREVRSKMTGNKSGLSKETIEQLSLLDAIFDYETHGSRLSFTQSANWLINQAMLPILPSFDKRAFGIFINRFCEVSWMIHRLIPNIQPLDSLLTDDWKEKWRIIDESFEYTVYLLTNEGGKKIGLAFVTFINAKFPFNEGSCFPL